MSRIYFDLCCFNRPFDDQSQLVIRLQTEAKLAIQESIQEGLHSLVWSSILDLENSANPQPQRREAISAWFTLAAIDIEATPAVEQTAESLTRIGLKALDALHVASALEGKADYFLTTDRAIMRKLKSEHRIRVMDPIDFIRELERDQDEV
jgi:predicted nucleic acid-binding protein